MAGVTVSMRNLSTTAPVGEFSNPGGAGNLSAATFGVSLDQFSQFQSQYEILEAQMKELAAKGEDSSIKLNGVTFLTVFCRVL